MNEFEIIKKYLKPLSKNNKAALELKDDIFFNNKNKIVLSLDTYVEGVDFIHSKNPKLFLKKVLRSALSDLYAKGVKPKNYFLSFSVKKNIISKTWLSNVKSVLFNEQKKYGISLSGGDMSTSSQFIITIIVLGYPNFKPILRNGAKENDDIYLTGNLANSFIGLSVIKKKINLGKYNNFFTNHYYEPKIQHKFSNHLNGIASSSIDVSDGLHQDLSHICKNSKFGATININSLPLSNIVKSLLKQKRLNLFKIFSRGDDYQILFTSHKKNRSKIVRLSKLTATKVTRIGFIKKNRKIDFLYNGIKFKFNPKNLGYIHKF